MRSCFCAFFFSVSAFSGAAFAADPAPATTTTTAPTIGASAPTNERSGLLAPKNEEQQKAPATTAKPRIAVVGFEGKELAPGVIASLEASVATEVSRLVNADVISAEDLRMLLNVSAYQTTLGCSEGACLESLGDALAVQQVISGSVRKASGKFTVTLSRLDTVNARVLQRTTVEVDDEKSLARAVRQATPALFGVIGRLEVWGQPAGAELFLDGQRIGETPLPHVDVRTPGKHTVEILGPTVTPWSTEFEMGAGNDVKLRAKNRPIVDVEADAAVWTIAGSAAIVGGVAAGAGAGACYFFALRNDQRIDAVIRTASQEELNAITDATLGYSIAAGTLGVVGVAAVAGGVGALILNPARAELDAALQ